MEFKNLLIESCDGITTVTINRPQALNALNSDVVRNRHAQTAHIKLKQRSVFINRVFSYTQ